LVSSFSVFSPKLFLDFPLFSRSLELLTFLQLIHQLYRPSAPGQVGKIQETLQRLQRSPEGWELAVNLLKNKDEQVRFFGALTFTVKLNTDS